MINLLYVKNKMDGLTIDSFNQAQNMKSSNEHIAVEFPSVSKSRVTEMVEDSEDYLTHAPIVAFQYLAQAKDKPIVSWVNHMVSRYDSANVVTTEIKRLTEKDELTTYEQYVCEMFLALKNSRERMFFDTLVQNSNFIYFLLHLLMLDLTRDQSDDHKLLHDERVSKRFRQDIAKKFDFIRNIDKTIQQNLRELQKSKISAIVGIVGVAIEESSFSWDMHRICYTDLAMKTYNQKIRNKKNIIYAYECSKTQHLSLGLFISIVSAIFGNTQRVSLDISFEENSTILYEYKSVITTELTTNGLGSAESAQLNEAGYNKWVDEKIEEYTKKQPAYAKIIKDAKERPIYIRPKQEGDNEDMRSELEKSFDRFDLTKPRLLPVTYMQLLQTIENDALRTGNVEAFYWTNQVWSLCNQLRLYHFNNSQLEDSEITDDINMPTHLLDVSSLTLMEQALNKTPSLQRNITFDDIVAYRDHTENNQLQNVLYALFAVCTKILNALKHTHTEAISMHKLRDDYETKIDTQLDLIHDQENEIQQLKKELALERNKKDNHRKGDLNRIKSLEKQLAPFERTKERLDERTAELEVTKARIHQLEQAYNDLLNEQPETEPTQTRITTPNGNPYGEAERAQLLAMLNRDKTLLIGGFPTWSSRLQTLIPNAEYISADSLSRNIEAPISRAKYIIFNTHVVNHSLYNRVKTAMPDTAIFCHFNAKTNDPENTLIYIYDELIHLGIIE